LTDHICDYCGESFTTSNELGGHVTAVHRRDQIVTDADLTLDDIRRVADELGKPPTAKEMSEHGEYSQRVCQKKFGSWNEALREAGYAPNRKFRLTDQDLLDEIDRLAEKFGRPPSSGEINEMGKYHKCTYLERFGGWEEALNEAGYRVVSPSTVLRSGSSNSRACATASGSSGRGADSWRSIFSVFRVFS